MYDWLAHLYGSLDLESHRRCIPLILKVGTVIKELCHTLNCVAFARWKTGRVSARLTIISKADNNLFFICF